MLNLARFESVFYEYNESIWMAVKGFRTFFMEFHAPDVVNASASARLLC